MAASFSAAVIARLSFVVGGERYFALFDDAMISMRYGRNLAHGHGLVWNVGQSPVEGYTNPLWTLWMAVVHLLPVGPRFTSFVVMLSGVAVLLATMSVAGRLTDRIAGGDSVATPIVLWLTAACYPLVFWTLLGMEVGLVALLLASAVLLAARWQDHGRVHDLWRLAAVLALTVLSRSDAVVLAGVIVAFVVVTARPEQRRMAIAALGLAVLGSLAVQTVFRLAYYHALLPNTYYLKVAGISLGARVRRGAEHLIGEGARSLYVPAVLAACALLPGRSTTRRRQFTWLLAALFVVQCVYIVYVGGDSYDGGEAGSRYTAVVLPMLVILAALGILSLLDVDLRSLRRRAVAISAVIVPVAAMRLADLQPGRRMQIGPTPPMGRAWALALPVLVLGGVWTLVWARRRPADDGRDRRRLAAALLGACLALASSAQYVHRWASAGSEAGAFDSRLTRLAVGLKQATDPRAVIATSVAGEISYFSDRPVVDLLGYSDRVIARRPPRAVPFVPGHDKWDLAYSIGVLKPDVVAVTWPAASPDDQNTIRSFGYEQLAPELYVRIGSPRVDVHALAAAARMAGLAPPG